MQIDSPEFKVITVVGTRPELIKLSRVICELDKYANQVIVHSGQNFDYELNEIFWKQLALRNPDYSLITAGKTLAQTIGNLIIELDGVFERERPDALLFLGDTNSCLAATLMAKRRKIPIFHMEAGNRSFDQRVPEENNRRAIDHLSDINMTFTEHSRRYLIAEGIRPETIIKVGCPVKEVLDYYMSNIQASEILTRLNLKSSEYFVVSAHREENIDSEINFHDFIESLRAIVNAYHRPVIVSTHPRTRKKLEEKNITSLEGIQFLKPMGLFDYVKLQMYAYCVVSDSGTVTEESSILNFPAVTIRQAHERPEGTEEGTLIMCGLKPERVLGAIATVISQHSAERRQFRLVSDYDVDNVSKKVVRIIISYIDYINRTVWHR